MNDLKIAFEQSQVLLLDRTEAPPEAMEFWAPVIITRGQIEAEASRLAALPAPADGRRETLIVHPSARLDCPGLAPGIRVTLSVLNPGERTKPMRHNATDVNFCIAGAGHAVVDGRSVAFDQYDVWNHPSYTIFSYVNDTRERQVRLTYSNVPLLQHMRVYLRDENPTAPTAQPSGEEELDARRTSPFGMFQLTDDGAMLMPYERLINPPPVESKSLHWPWKRVKAELDKLEALGKEYVGRRLYLLYNPVTGRTNGTTPNFFATMTIRPPKIVDRPHRHVSAAINYYFKGSGYSVVAGNTYKWKAGDLMLSAPGWAVHNHASDDVDYVYELTVQDQPLNILMESLLWQEDLKKPAIVLGTRPGFDTNRATVAA